MRINIFSKLLKKYQLQQDVITEIPIRKLDSIVTLKPLHEQSKLDVESATESINDTLNTCAELIRKYEKISDYEYKAYGQGFWSISTLKAFKSRLETFLNLLKSRTHPDDIADLLDNIEAYFLRINITLPDISKEITDKYNITAVDSSYRFTGSNISKWREEASSIFPNIDLSLYTDFQLKEYVVAYKNGVSQDLLIKLMNPSRAPEHIRLMFLLPESEMLDVFSHPEYSTDKVRSLFPEVLDKTKRELK